MKEEQTFWRRSICKSCGSREVVKNKKEKFIGSDGKCIFIKDSNMLNFPAKKLPNSIQFNNTSFMYSLE